MRKYLLMSALLILTLLVAACGSTDTTPEPMEEPEEVMEVAEEPEAEEEEEVSEVSVKPAEKEEPTREEAEPAKPRVTFEFGDTSAINSAEDVIVRYANGELTQAQLVDEMWGVEEFGELSRQSFGSILAAAVDEGVLSVEDVQVLILEPYGNYDIQMSDAVQMIYPAYTEGLYSVDDLRELYIGSYQKEYISNHMSRQLIYEGFNSYDLSYPVFADLTVGSYADGYITMTDLHWYLSQGMKAKKLTREPIQYALIDYGIGEEKMTLKELRDFLAEAYDELWIGRGEIDWIIRAGHAKKLFDEDGLDNVDIYN